MTTVATAVLHDTFTANDEVQTITAMGVAYSDDATAALSSNSKTGLTLLNFGGIVNSGGGDGLVFTSTSTGTIVNEASGYISGEHGVLIDSTGVSLTNFGLITGIGDAGVKLDPGSSDTHIDNRGSIFGEYGIKDWTGNSGGTIVNYGTIEGKTAGIDLWTTAGTFTNVINHGAINGGIDVGSIHVGSLMLSNTGTISGGISLASTSSLDADQIYNTGVINGGVSMGAGNDLFLGSGGAAVNVSGGDGADHISGSNFGDTLNGGDGNDNIWGEGGSDTLTGGTGADNFIFDSALKSAGVDTITDFTHALDSIHLSHAIFTATNTAGTLAGGMFFVGAHAHDANDRIIYNPNNGWLTYDKNGSAAGGVTHFATLDAHLTVSAADFLIT